MGVFITLAYACAPSGGNRQGPAKLIAAVAQALGVCGRAIVFLLRSLLAPSGPVASSGCLSSSLPPSFASGRSATTFYSGG